jgi:hypothetical protein
MKGTLLFRAAALAGLASAALFLAQSASADTIDVHHYTTPIVISSSAGTVDIVNVYVENKSDHVDTITSIGGGTNELTWTNDGGNPYDVVDSVTIIPDTLTSDGCSVGEQLAADGGTCDIEMAITVSGQPKVKHATDGTEDLYGDNEVYIEVDATYVGGTVNKPKTLPVSGTATFNARVDYDGPVATPEPGSLLLLGTGMLGLAGVVRRRLRRS